MLQLTFYPSGQVEWIDRLRKAVATGYLHVAFIAICLVWTITAIHRSGSVKIAPVSLKASRISKRYELPAQVIRAGALAYSIVTAVQATSQPWHWYNAVLVGFAVFFGLARLTSNTKRRHIALHQANFLVLVALLLLAIGELLPMAVLQSPYRSSNAAMGALAFLAASVLLAVCTPREWMPPAVSLDLFKRPADEGPAPEETCSWWTKYITYEWLTPVIWKGKKMNSIEIVIPSSLLTNWLLTVRIPGCRRPVEMDELPPLPYYDEPLLLLSRVQEARAKSKNTFMTTMRFVRKEVALMVTYTAITFTLELVSPFAMYQLLDYIASPETAILSPVLWLGLLFFGPMARTVTFQQYIFTSTRLIVRVKAGFTQELYHRAMESMEVEGDVLNDAKGQALTAKKSTYAGQLQNLMAGDIDAIWMARDVVMLGIGAPLGTAMAFIGLYKILDWPALVGAGLLIMSIPLPTYFAQLMGKSQRQMKATQDARISLISEYLGSIRAIKFFAWEDAMAAIVDAARGAEQKVIWRISLLSMGLNQVSEIMPMIALVVMFSLYVAVREQPLTASVAFTTLTLVSIMRNNIQMASYFSKSATNAMISFERLDRFFNNTAPMVQFPEGPLRIQNATFKRNKKADFSLANISIDFVHGGLNTIVGASGSGKTTLLLSILVSDVEGQGKRK